MKNQEKYVLKSLIVCDDVRSEASGKDIIIGVYNDSIVFKAFPALLPKLSFRIMLIANTKIRDLIFLVEGDNGQEFFRAEIKIEDIATGKPAVFNMGMSPARFDGPNIYPMFLEVDGERKKIGEFDVRTPVDDEEKDRFRK
jgi:hypothetical protein